MHLQIHVNSAKSKIDFNLCIYRDADINLKIKALPKLMSKYNLHTFATSYAYTLFVIILANSSAVSFITKFPIQ